MYSVIVFLYLHVRTGSVMSDQLPLCADKFQAAIKSFYPWCMYNISIHLYALHHDVHMYVYPV